MQSIAPQVSYYSADVLTYSDYYPFGMQMPNRNGQSDEYRYGLNGMERDDELKSDGNSYDFGARIYDPRIARWLAVDPKFNWYPSFSPYCYAMNSPNKYMDRTGNHVEPTEAVTGNTHMNSVFKVVSQTDIFKELDEIQTLVIKIDYNHLSREAISNGESILVFPRGQYKSRDHMVVLNTSIYPESGDYLQTAAIKTMVHELFHAKLYVLAETITGEDFKNRSKSSANINEQIAYYVAKYGTVDDHNNQRGWQHNWMADHARGDIIDAMKQNDKSKGIERGTTAYSSDDWYNAISYSGLEGTDSWNNLSDETKEMYREIISEAHDDEISTSFLLNEVEAVYKEDKTDNANQDTTNNVEKD